MYDIAMTNRNQIQQTGTSLSDAPANSMFPYVLGIAGLAFFLIALILLLSGHASLIDDPIRHWFYALRRDGLNEFVSHFTLLGNWQVIVALCIAFLVIPKTRIGIGVPLAAGSLIIVITNKILKHIVQRPRPDDILFLVPEDGFSFPSGHSISSMFAYGILLYFVLTKIKSTALKTALAILLTVLTFGIGLSRIFIGVHFPTDVLAGWSLGALGIAVTIWILQKLRSSSEDGPTL